jgi:hypothetical protein
LELFIRNVAIPDSLWSSSPRVALSVSCSLPKKCIGEVVCSAPGELTFSGPEEVEQAEHQERIGPILTNDEEQPEAES